MARPLLRRRIAILALATGLSLCIAGPPASVAAPTLTQEERHGEAIAETVRAGETRCADLSAAEFELIGEYAMGHYLGSVATHSAMNVRMTRTMGELGDRRMHGALGHRYSGCSGGPTSDWVRPVAGMMALPGAKMGSGGHGNLEITTLGGVLIAIGSAALGAGAAALLSRRRGRARQDAAS
jgi:hypothetical protein